MVFWSLGVHKHWRTCAPTLLLLGIILLLFAAPCAAQTRLVFHNLNTQQNIGPSYVRSIVRDRHGAMWLLMMNHVERYDGYRFHHYEVGGMPVGGDALHDLRRTADGRLWVTGTRHNYVLNERLDRIDTICMADLHPYDIANEVERIFVDRRENLWCVSTNGQTLYHYDFASRRLYRMDITSEMGNVLDLCVGGDRVYVLTSGGDAGCTVWTAETKGRYLTTKAITDIAATDLLHIYVDSRGRLWLYALNDTWLHLYDETTASWRDAAAMLGLDGAMITALTDDGSAGLWIGTGNRGIIVVEAEGRLIAVEQEASAPFHLMDNHINCFYRDTETATLWVGTSKQGAVFTGSRLTSVSLSTLSGAEDVSCLDTDPDGSLWVGFDSQGIGHYKIEDSGLKSEDGLAVLTTRNSALSSNQVICTLRDSRGRRWWGTYGGNLNYADTDGTIKTIDDSRMSHVISIQEDDEGRIWVGTFYNGVFCIDGTMGRILRTVTMRRHSILRSDCITQLLFDNYTHRLYIATNAGLYVLNTLDHTLQCLMEGDIRTILLTNEGQTLWVGLNTGLTIMNDEEQTHLTTRHGLSHNTIFALVEDGYGSVWASTKSGITRITPLTSADGTRRYRCTATNEADGLAGICFNLHAATRLSDSTLLFGALGNIVSVTSHPDPAAPRHHFPIRFTSLALGGERVRTGEPTSDGRILLSENLMTTDHLTLRHNDRNVTIEVSDMDCYAQQSQHYLYRLRSADAWQELEGHAVILGNLSPGNYRLQVRLDNPDGEGAEDDGGTASLRIRVTPPWYLTWMALAAYVLLAATALWLFLHHRRRLTQQRAEKRQREMVLEQRMKMDEAKMRFFTNVSHDMRTPLSLIVTPLHRLLGGKLDPDVRRQLELVCHSADTLQEEVTQLLDFRRLDQALDPLYPTEGSLSQFVQNVCQPFVGTELQGGVTLSVNLPEDDAVVTRFDHTKMKSILRNLISNAIKYNKAGGQVTVALAHEGDNALISVSDQGIGIRPENRERIFERFFQEQHDGTTYMGSGIGLHLVGQYVAMMGGTIAVTDAHPHGSVFTVRLPLEKIEDERATPIPTHEGQPPPSPPEGGVIGLPTLLIVEDNDDFRSFLQSCLTERYRLLTAANGKEALDLLSQGNEEVAVQLIISDVMMPIMDGMEFCRRVKGDIRFSHIPFIMLTARTTDQQQADGLHEGADDYITKPFNLDILILRIERLLRWAEGAQERFQKMDVKPAELTVSHIDEQLIAKAIAHVEEHISDPDYSVEQLTTAMAMSRSGLYKKLTAITGLSPQLFIRTLRIKRGRQLLEQSGESVSQVAYRVGLSPKQFAKYFRETYGILPSEFVVNQNKA